MHFFHLIGIFYFLQEQNNLHSYSIERRNEKERNSSKKLSFVERGLYDSLLFICLITLFCYKIPFLHVIEGSSSETFLSFPNGLVKFYSCKIVNSWHSNYHSLQSYLAFLLLHRKNLCILISPNCVKKKNGGWCSYAILYSLSRSLFGWIFKKKEVCTRALKCDFPVLIKQWRKWFFCLRNHYHRKMSPSLWQNNLASSRSATYFLLLDCRNM